METISNQLGGVGSALRGLQGQADELGKTLSSAFSPGGSGYQSMSRGVSQLSGQINAAFAYSTLERFGDAGKKAFGGMIQSARDLETAMVGVKMATNASDMQMKNLRASIEPIIGRHGMTEARGFEMAQRAGATGLNTAQIAGRFESMASFADVMRTRGMDEVGATNLLLQSQGLFSARTDEQAKTVADNLAKALFSTTAAPGALQTTMRNLAPAGIMAGWGVDKIMSTAAQLATVQGARGGTEATRLMMDVMTGKEVLMSRRSHGVDRKAQIERLGLGEFEGKPINDPLAVFKAISHARETDPTFIKDMAAVGGVAERLAGIVNADFVASMEQVREKFQKMGGVQDLFNQTTNTGNYWLGVMNSNLQSTGARLGELGATAIKPLTKMIADLADPAHFKNHPIAQNLIGAGVLGGEVISTGANIAGKVGMASIGFQAMKGLFQGRAGLPVFVTNLPGGLGGVSPLQPGTSGVLGALGKAGAVVGAGAAGYAAGELIDAGLTHLLGKSIGESLYDAFNRGGDKVRDDEHQRVQAAKTHALLHPGSDSGNSITFHDATINVHGVTDVKSLNDALQKAANSHSGSSSTSPSHSTSSGFGGTGGP